jgi:hypothetical protein
MKMNQLPSFIAVIKNKKFKKELIHLLSLHYLTIIYRVVQCLCQYNLKIMRHNDANKTYTINCMDITVHANYIYCGQLYLDI